MVIFHPSTWRLYISAWAIANVRWTTWSRPTPPIQNGWGVKEDHMFDSLRSEPRFKALMKKLRFDS